MEQSNAFIRGDQLTMTGNRHAVAKRLDNDVLNASLSAEKRIKKYKSPAWSVSLAKARETVIFLSSVCH
jgi:hypothetical protein